MAYRVLVRNLRDHRLRMRGVPGTRDVPVRDDERGRSEAAGSQLTNKGLERRKVCVDEESAGVAQHVALTPGSTRPAWSQDRLME